MSHTHTHTRGIWTWTCVHDNMTGNMHIYAHANACKPTDILFRRWIMWEYANTHTHSWDRHANGNPLGLRWGSPLWPESPYSPSPLPPHTLLTHVTHNQPPSPVWHTHTHAHTHTHTHLDCPCLFPTYHITPPTHCVCLSHASAHTHTETWRVPCLTPGPRRSLVWRPVCVCLASNGPFKCRIFTADRAILRDSHTEAWICFGSIILKEVILIIITQCHTDWQWVSVLWPSTRSLCSSCTALNRATRISFLLIVI